MSLTEDFINKKLENGKSYYVKMYADGDIKILQALDDKEEGQVLGDSKFIYTPCEIPEIYDVEEVIAPVPSYEKLQELRELLKDCRPALSHLGKWNTKRQYLLTRINTAIGESEE